MGKKDGNVSSTVSEVNCDTTLTIKTDINPGLTEKKSGSHRSENAENAEADAKKDGKALKAGGWYVISSFVNKALSAILTPILTRILTKEEFGDFSNFSSWCGLLMVITSLNLSNVVLRAKFDYESDEEYDQYLSTISVTTIASTAIFYFIVMLFPGFFTGLFGMDMLYIHIMFLYLLFDPAYNYYMAKQRVYLKYKAVSVITLISSLVTIGGSILLASAMENGFLGRTIGFVAPTIAIGLVVYISYISKGRRIRRDMITYSLKISLPLIPHYISTRILYSSDRVIIKQFCSSEDVAVYSLGYSISSLVTMFQGSINGAYLPWFYEQLKKERFPQVRKVSSLLNLSALYIEVGVLLLSPELILIFGGQQYMDALRVMPPVVAGVTVNFIVGLYNSYQHYMKNSASVSMSTMTAAAVNLGLNILLIPKFGYVAAAYTTLIGYLVMLTIYVILLKKSEYWKVPNHPLLLSSAAGSILISLVFPWIYTQMVLRYILSAIFIVATLVLGIYLLKKYKWKKS